MGKNLDKNKHPKKKPQVNIFIVILDEICVVLAGQNITPTVPFFYIVKNSDLSTSPVNDLDRRKKRNYRNKVRSPTPPPSKMPRNMSPVP